MKCKSFFWLVVIGFIAISCNEFDDGSYVAPITVYEKINGDWSLMNLKMVDQYAKLNAIEPSEQNLSAMFNYEDFIIRFGVDENLNPTFYEVLGNVPPLFPPKGFWELSSPYSQTDSGALKIYLYKDAQKTEKTDELRLTSIPGSSGEMEIQLIRVSGDAAFVSYIFKLKATN